MNKEKFKVIATKVSTFVKERIGRICKKRGLNEYDMLQMMCISGHKCAEIFREYIRLSNEEIAEAMTATMEDTNEQLF